MLHIFPAAQKIPSFNKEHISLCFLIINVTEGGIEDNSIVTFSFINAKEEINQVWATLSSRDA